MTHRTLDKPIANLVSAQGLPGDFQDTVARWYVPLANNIAQCHKGTPLVIGVQGSQGSGKSTLAQFLKLLLEQQHQLRCVELSLDDFYLTLAERQKLAASVHPLFITRGVPGTHDVKLAIDTINALISIEPSQDCAVPRFNKAVDDRFPTNEWDSVASPIDIIIFEGWCVGVNAQTEADLLSPVNNLEQDEDPKAIWRHHSNQALEQDYAKLFSMLDKLVVLEAPSFECVYDWRWLQEQKLVAQWQRKHPDEPARLLDETSVRRFISHYERLTRHGFASLPTKADWLLSLNNQHEITNLVERI